MEKRVWSLRAALSLDSKDREEMIIRMGELLLQVFEKNAIDPADILSIQFTQTGDIQHLNAAHAARLSECGDVLAKTPLFCSLEPPVNGSPGRLIRLLVTYYHSRDHSPEPVYLYEARKLRSDLFPN